MTKLKNLTFYLLRSFLTIIFLGSVVTSVLYLQLLNLMTSPAQVESLQLGRNKDKTFLNVVNKSPSFGFDNLFADWIFLNFIQYFGDTLAREQLGYALAPEFFESIINKDPRFVDAYLVLEPATSLFAGKPEKSIKIMDYGLTFLSPKIYNSFYIWLYKAVDELLFTKDVNEAKTSYLMAAEWAFIQRDENSKFIGEQAINSATFLAKNPDSTEVRASSWLLVLSNAKDQKTINLAIEKIKELGGEVKIEGNTVSVKF